MKSLSRTRTIGGSLVVTIPVEIVKGEGLKEGEFVEVEVKNLLDSQLENNVDISILGKIELSNKFLGPHKEDYIKKRVKKKLNMFVICEPGKGAQDLKKKDKSNLRKTKAHDVCKNMKATLVSFNDNAAIITFLKEDPVGLFIHDKNIAETFQTIFQELWNSAK